MQPEEQSERSPIARFAQSWQIVLMGLTSVALSLASGWTTWDGMIHFTSGPVLSFLITFGIQGVMLVSAWLIVVRTIQERRRRPVRIALLLVFSASMAASVFFSFDSLFDKVYTDADRALRGEIRVRNAVSDLLVEQRSEIEDQEARATSALFRSSDWQGFSATIDRLIAHADDRARVASEAAKTQTEKNQSLATKLVAARHVATARQSMLKSELARNTTQIAKLQADLGDSEKELSTLTKQKKKLIERLVRESADAESERLGIGQTGKAGRGPRYAMLKKKSVATKVAIEANDQQIAQVRSLIAQQTQELARAQQDRLQIEAKLAQVREAERAGQQQLEKLSPPLKEEGREAADIRTTVKALQAARTDFAARPTITNRKALEQSCHTLQKLARRGALAQPNEVTEGVCDIGHIGNPLTAALKATSETDRYLKVCGDGSQLKGLTADQAMRFGERCVIEAGLPTAQSTEQHSLLRRASIERDDVAHRFVVSWNAFLDANPLAFLALSLALMIDGLVFVSGFCGARALAATQRPLDESSASPLSEPTVHRLLAAAFLPAPAHKARQLLSVVEYNGDGDLSGATLDIAKASPAERPGLRSVADAAVASGLVERDIDVDRYCLSNAFLDCLAEVFEGADRSGGKYPGGRHGETLLRLAARRDPYDLASALLAQSRPVAAHKDEDRSYLINLADWDDPRRATARAVLNGAVGDGVATPDPDQSDVFTVKPAFFVSLADALDIDPACKAMEPRRWRKTRVARRSITPSPAPSHEPSSRITVFPASASRANAQTKAPTVEGRSHTESSDKTGSNSVPQPACVTSTSKPVDGVVDGQIRASAVAPQFARGGSQRPPSFDASAVKQTLELNEPENLSIRPGSVVALEKPAALFGDDIAALIDAPRDVAKTKAACAALNVLARLDDALKETLTSSANSYRDELRRRLRRSKVAYGSTQSVSTETHSQLYARAHALLEKHFDMLFLTTFGLDLARSWFARFVEETELLVEFQVPLAKDDLDTGTLMPLAAALAAADDDDQASTWAELTHRLAVLSRPRHEGPGGSLAPLMP